MSTLPDNEFDLEKLFLPAWAKETPSTTQYSKYEGVESREDHRGGRGPRERRRDDRASRPRRQEGQQRDDRGPRRPETARPEAGRREFPSGDRRGPRRRDFGDRRPPPPPLPDVAVTFMADEKGVESLTRQIKMTGRAYPLFDIARMILEKPERHSVVLSVKKNAEGKAIQPLFVCALDDTLWTSEDAAIAHVLKKHFTTFYQADRTATEPPKGKYTFVAQCGMSGVILGPPNYHDYQAQLRKLHSERFSRMPFEVYKSRVKFVRDEEVVKKWVDDQSWKTEYICLNLPEATRLATMEAVETHFRENHKENIIRTVESHTLGGAQARSMHCADLARLVRQVGEDQMRFPLQIATSLSQQFTALGLHFFKVNKTITHVCVARPSYLDLEATPVSEGVKRLVEYIHAHPKSTRRQVVPALAPAPTDGAQRTTPSQPPEPSAEQSALIADLHWLIHQGHVIEFANGTLELAKKPVPKPPRPEPKTPEKPAQSATAAESAPQSESAEPSPQAESSPEPQAGPDTCTPPNGEVAPGANSVSPSPAPGEDSAAQTETAAPTANSPVESH